MRGWSITRDSKNNKTTTVQEVRRVGLTRKGEKCNSLRSNSSLVPARHPIIVPRRRIIRYAHILSRRLCRRCGGHGHRWLSLRVSRLEPRGHDVPLNRCGVLRRALRALRKGVVRLLGLWYRWCWGIGVYGGHGWCWCLRSRYAGCILCSKV